jgi:hypothetical protein
MNTDVKKMSFPRALIAGFFCGFITAIVIILFEAIYRMDTGLEKIGSIDPLTLAVGTPIAIVLISCVYFLFVHYLSRGELLYKILLLVLTIGGLMLLINLQASNRETILTLPNGLLFGIIGITGLADIFFLPYLAHHPGIYLTRDELKF